MCPAVLYVCVFFFSSGAGGGGGGNIAQIEKSTKGPKRSIGFRAGLFENLTGSRDTKEVMASPLHNACTHHMAKKTLKRVKRVNLHGCLTSCRSGVYDIRGYHIGVLLARGSPIIVTPKSTSLGMARALSCGIDGKALKELIEVKIDPNSSLP